MSRDDEAKDESRVALLPKCFQGVNGSGCAVIGTPSPPGFSLLLTQDRRFGSGLLEELLPVGGVFAEVVPEPCEVGQLRGAPPGRELRRSRGRVAQVVVQRMPLFF